MALSLGKKGILKRLSEIIDPELGINIVDLGLIYEVNISPATSGKAVSGSEPSVPKRTNAKPGLQIQDLERQSSTCRRLETRSREPQKNAHVEVKMTLTSIGCPLAGFFAMQAEEKVKQMKGVKDAHVHIVWEPPWTPEKMSSRAKKTLGML